MICKAVPANEPKYSLHPVMMPSTISRVTLLYLQAHTSLHSIRLTVPGALPLDVLLDLLLQVSRDLQQLFWSRIDIECERRNFARHRPFLSRPKRVALVNFPLMLGSPKTHRCSRQPQAWKQSHPVDMATHKENNVFILLIIIN